MRASGTEIAEALGTVIERDPHSSPVPLLRVYGAVRKYLEPTGRSCSMRAVKNVMRAAGLFITPMTDDDCQRVPGIVVRHEWRQFEREHGHG